MQLSPGGSNLVEAAESDFSDWCNSKSDRDPRELTGAYPSVDEPEWYPGSGDIMRCIVGTFRRTEQRALTCVRAQAYVKPEYSTILDFARYVLKTHLKKATDNVKVTWVNARGGKSRREVAKVLRMGSVRKGGPLEYYIRVDVDYLRKSRDISGRELDMVVARLLLHEIGHLALNPDVPMDPAVAEEMESAPEEEKAAWQYALTVFGLALSAIAEDRARAWYFA